MSPRQMAMGVVGILGAIVVAILFVVQSASRRRARREIEDSPAAPVPLKPGASAARAQKTKPSSSGSEGAAEQAARLDAIRKLHVVAFGTAFGPATDMAADGIAAAVRLSLATVVDKPNYAPRRPMLLPKLVQAINDDGVSRRELAQIVASDPALTANLLRLANSPFYRLGTEPIESLDRAVAVLGIEGMRSLVSAALMQPVFRISGGSFAHFGDVTWQHTLYAARGAEAHAAILENSDPFAAQLLSLMVGLAVIVVFRVALDEYVTRRAPPQPSVMAALIDSQSALVARHIAASWELSDRFDAALADQISSPLSSKTALGRSLQFGRFIGALVVLQQRHIIDDDQVTAALKSAGEAAGAYERIWARLTAQR